MGNVAQGNDESATDQHSQQVHADRAPDALALLMTRSSFDTFRQMDANLGGGYTRPIYQALWWDGSLGRVCTARGIRSALGGVPSLVTIVAISERPRSERAKGKRALAAFLILDDVAFITVGGPGGPTLMTSIQRASKVGNAA